MVIIITGTIGIGKTTVCEQIIKIARRKGYRCGGITTHKAQNEDIIIKNVQTGITEILASISNIYQGPRTVKYFFNPKGIEFGIKAIDKDTDSDIILVDELGHIELAGDGFAKVIEQVVAGKIKNCILVIRKELLSGYLSRLGTTLPVYETTVNNRIYWYHGIFI